MNPRAVEPMDGHATPTLRIVRGPRRWLRAHPFFTAAPGRLVVASPSAPAVPWGGLRDLLGRVADSEGLDARLDAHRVPMSLVLRGLSPRLDSDERSQASRLAAQLPGYLSHNSIMSWPLRQAWTEVLAPTLRDREVVIPDVMSLDPESLVVLWGLLRRCPTMTLVLGWDPVLRGDDPLWRRDALRARNQLGAMAALDFAQVQQHDGRLCAAREATQPSAQVHPLDDDGERRAFSALREGPVEAAMVLEAIEQSFACFGFTTALRLGLDLLAHDSSAFLDATRRRRLHLLMAIAAYNRQVETQGESDEADRALAEMLDAHLRASLVGETDPCLRAHAAYRLTINAGRRQGDLDAALGFADEAVAAAQEAAAPYHEAWALNGRAYVRGRLRDVGGAIADVERAYALAEERVEEPLDVERTLTRAVLADNLSMLHTYAGEAKTALAWQERWAELGEELDGGSMPSQRWLEMLRDALELERASALAERGMKEAEQYLSPALVDLYATLLGDLRYRAGEAEAALAAFRRTLAIARRGEDGALLWATLMSTALAAWRAGDGAEAEALIDELMVLSVTGEPKQAEAMAMLGVFRASAGDSAGSEDAINHAIALAVEIGERDLLLRVACAAGRACLALGRREESQAAFERALELADETAAAADRFDALVGALQTSPPTPERVAEALSLLEAALRDAETWWLLDDLERAYVRSPAGDPKLLRAAQGCRAPSRGALAPRHLVDG